MQTLLKVKKTRHLHVFFRFEVQRLLKVKKTENKRDRLQTFVTFFLRFFNKGYALNPKKTGSGYRLQSFFIRQGKRGKRGKQGKHGRVCGHVVC